MVFASHVGRITPRIKSNRYLCNHHSAKWPPGVQSADNGCQTPSCPHFKSQAGSELRKRSRNPKCCSDPSPSVELRQNWWVGPLPGSWPALRPKSLPYFATQCLHKSRPKQIKMLQSTQNSESYSSQSLLVVEIRPIWLDRSASWLLYFVDLGWGTYGTDGAKLALFDTALFKKMNILFEWIFWILKKWIFCLNEYSGF